MQYGGFPDPFLHADQKFYNLWMKDRDHQLFQEDLKQSDKHLNTKNINKLAELLKNRVKQRIDYNSMAKDLKVSEEQIKSWIVQLENHYYCFEIPVWNRQVTKSICKNPKIYLWDWSELSDKGARYENLVALHLKKAIEFWNDNGGKYALYYLQIKQGGEVDFFITKDHAPWLMVEVKSSKEAIHPALDNFNKSLKEVPHVLQVTAEMPYEDIDCFSLKKPSVVPMVTFLSQLV